MVRRVSPYLVLAVLTLGTGLGIGLGLSEAPGSHSKPTQPQTIPSTTSATLAKPRPTPTTGPSSPSIEQLAFFNATSGYGLFSNQVNGECQALVGSTDDGGAQFSPLTLLTSSPCGFGNPLSSLAFDDHGDGFAYGPGLFVTHNGGQRWQSVSVAGPVLAVSALGYSVWMVEQGCSTDQFSMASPAPCPLDLLQSSDGGRTWHPPPMAPQIAIAPGSFPFAGQSWLVRVSQAAAYLLTAPAPNANVASNQSTFSFTDDSGSTWSPGSVPCGITGWATALSVAPDGTLVSVCAGQPSAGQQLKSVSVSTDGGQTWTIENPCPTISNYCIASSGLEHGYLGQVDALSASTAFVYGDRSDLMVTRDGGKDWLETPVTDGGGGPAQVVFFDFQNGVALGYGPGGQVAFAIWHTSNGGSTWNAATP